MRVKATTFFYNKNLLRRISTEETDTIHTGHLLGDSLNIGDLIKYIGDDLSCIVEVVKIGNKDVNSNRSITTKLIKVVKGELEIDY